MKVLFVTHGYPPRGRFGTEFYTHQLVHGLLERGHAAEVLHPVRSGTKPRYTLECVREEGVPVHLLENAGGPGKDFEESYRDPTVERIFGELLDRTKPDIVHFTYLLWGLSVRLPEIARERGVPTVITLTDYGLLCHRGQMFDFELKACGGPQPPAVCARCIREPGLHDLAPVALALKRVAVRALSAVGGLGRVVVTRDVERRAECVRNTLSRVSALIAPTMVLARAFERSGVPPEKLEHIVYAFDEDPYAARRGTPAPDPPRFGFLAQFAPHKGLGTLLEATALLAARVPERPFEVVLHGTAPGGRHRLYAERLLGDRLPERVTLGAPFEPRDAPRIFSGFSAIVLPSEWDENAPLSVLQARALGVPVLGTEVSGIAEALSAEAAERLVPVGDAEALSRRMQEVLDGGIGREFTPGLPLAYPEHLDKIEALYARIAGGLG